MVAGEEQDVMTLLQSLAMKVEAAETQVMQMGSRWKW